MKLAPAAIVALALVAALTLALLPAQQQPAANAAAAESSEKVLVETMEVLAGNYRTVRRQARDASQNADTAEKLAEMIDASVRAKGALPKTATNDEMKQQYRVIMNKLIIVLAQAENAALEGDQDALNKFVREANSVKGEGHEMFIAD